MLEYFWDIDPGIGLAASTTISPSLDSVNLNVIINTNGLSTGPHYLYMRCRDFSGIWSLSEARLVTVTGSITSAEYFFDNDPGVGLATVLSVSGAPDDSVNFTKSINTTGLTIGDHYLYIRTKDNSGVWSLSEAKLVTVTGSIIAAEYFFDNDPGVGLATVLSVTGAPNDSVNFTKSINTTGLSLGDHYLYIRTKDNAGIWSLSEARSVTIIGSITAAEYFFDNDPGVGIATQITVTGAPDDSVNFTKSISTSGLTIGDHYLYFRTKDNAGHWSLSEARIVMISGSIISAEYFFDNDPGIGLATSISVTGAPDDSVNFTTSISTFGLTIGVHYLYFRTKDNSGLWSLSEGRSVTVEGSITSAEYFFDNDPGIGLATSVSVTSAPDDSVNFTKAISTTGLTIGDHYLYFRTKDNLGVWSLSEARMITITGSIIAAEYFFDNDPGYGLGNTLPILNAPSDSVNITDQISTSALTLGLHYLYVRTRDNNGVWSLIERRSVYLGSCNASLSANGPVTFCSPGSVRLTSTGGSSYLWSNGSTTGFVDITTSGTYSCAVVNEQGCESISNSITVTVNPIPSTPVANSNSPLCEGETLNLTSSTIPGASYSWTSSNGFISNLQNPSVTNANNSSNGNYSVTAYISGCPSAVSNIVSVVINVNPTAPSISSDSPLCAGETLHLNASLVTDATYTWIGPSGLFSTQQNPVVNNVQNSVNGNYYSTATVNGCTSLPSNTIAVLINPIPSTPVASSNSPLCNGSTLNLFSSPVSGATYSWTSSNGFFSNLQNPSVANANNSSNGNYSVTSYISGCTSAVSNIISVVINANPAAPAINSDSPLCSGETLHLTASTISGATYEWTGPSGVFSALQNPIINNAELSANGNYFATASMNGCTSAHSDTLNVVINPTPPAPIASSNTNLLCEGNTLNLFSIGEPNAIFSWSGPNAFNSSDQNPVFTNAHDYESGNYSLVQYVGLCASPYSNVVSVLISPYPSAPITSSNSPVCEGDTLHLAADTIPGAVYFWSGPNYFSSNDQNPSIEYVGLNANGEYAVTVSVNGCESPQGVVATIGNGTGTNTNVTYPAPYGTWNYGARHQMIYRSAELTAAGLSTGSVISQMGFDVVYAEPGAVYQLFTMSIKNTSASDLSSGFEVMPITNYNGGTIIPFNGWNLISLDHPFTWDGTSNIIVEVCHDADGNLGGAFNFNSLTRMSTGLPPNTTRWRAQNMPCGGPPNESYGGVTTERPDIRFVVAGQFENVIVKPSPYISVFNPDFGAAGTPVTIDGGGFTGATNVNFNLTAATYSVNSDNQIATTVPAGATDGLIEVIASNGCSVVSSTNFLVTVNGFTMHLNLFIQGMYSGGGIMTSPLFNSGLTINSNECDSILVELHDGYNPSLIVDSKTVILYTDGHADIEFTNVPNGSLCYIVIKHRNSIETWSKDAFIFMNNSSFQYDFSHF